MTTHTRHRLPVKTKLAFGAGDTGPAIVAAINGFFLNAFLLQVAKLDPYMTGIIFLIAKIILFAIAFYTEQLRIAGACFTGYSGSQFYENPCPSASAQVRWRF